MEATHPLSTPAAVTSTAAHPLVLAAAASVTVLSLTGVAYLAGWLPGPTNPGAAERPLAAASQATMPRIPCSIPLRWRARAKLYGERMEPSAGRWCSSISPNSRRARVGTVIVGQAMPGSAVTSSAS